MKLYFKFFAIHLKSEMAYPASFFLSCCGRLILLATSLVSIRFLMDRFGSIAGHTLGEVLLGFGVVMTASNLAECFARGFDAFSRIVREAQFDRLMVRPRNLVFQVICQDLRLASAANVLAGCIVILRAARISGILWTLPKILTLASMVLCGSLLFFGVFLIYAALCFVTLEGLEFMNIFTDGIRQYSQYPYAVYGKGVLWFTTVIMPMAMVQYWPLQYLMGNGPRWYGLFPLLSLWFLGPCYAVWRLGVRHYRSAGS
jgi:ABC-2 type transport system permease protein